MTLEEKKAKLRLLQKKDKLKQLQAAEAGGPGGSTLSNIGTFAKNLMGVGDNAQIPRSKLELIPQVHMAKQGLRALDAADKLTRGVPTAALKVGMENEDAGVVTGRLGEKVHRASEYMAGEKPIPRYTELIEESPGTPFIQGGASGAEIVDKWSPVRKGAVDVTGDILMSADTYAPIVGPALRGTRELGRIGKNVASKPIKNWAAKNIVKKGRKAAEDTVAKGVTPEVFEKMLKEDIEVLQNPKKYADEIGDKINPAKLANERRLRRMDIAQTEYTKLTEDIIPQLSARKQANQVLLRTELKKAGLGAKGDDIEASIEQMANNQKVQQLVENDVAMSRQLSKHKSDAKYFENQLSDLGELQAGDIAEAQAKNPVIYTKPERLITVNRGMRGTEDVIGEVTPLNILPDDVLQGPQKALSEFKAHIAGNPIGNKAANQRIIKALDNVVTSGEARTADLDGVLRDLDNIIHSTSGEVRLKGPPLQKARALRHEVNELIGHNDPGYAKLKTRFHDIVDIAPDQAGARAPKVQKEIESNINAQRSNLKRTALQVGLAGAVGSRTWAGTTLGRGISEAFRLMADNPVVYRNAAIMAKKLGYGQTFQQAVMNGVESIGPSQVEELATLFSVISPALEEARDTSMSWDLGVGVHKGTIIPEHRERYISENVVNDTSLSPMERYQTIKRIRTQGVP